jgi:ribonuclease P protein component
MQRLTRRSEYLAVARGRRIRRSGFLLQAVQSATSEPRPARIGFTVTRKTGGAVVRNRIRRRLKEAIRVAADAADLSTDYVVIGRRKALALPFGRLVNDLKSGLTEISFGRNAGNRAHKDAR